MLTRIDLSLEFLMGRALDNAMLNVEQKDIASSESSFAKIQPLALLMLLQRVLPISASAWKMSSLRSTMLLSVTAVLDVSLHASSIQWLP